MFNVVNLIDMAPEADRSGRDQVLIALRNAASHAAAERILVEPTLPGTRNVGDILMHLRFTSWREWHFVAALFDDVLRDPMIRHINGATYTGSPCPTKWSATPGSIYSAPPAPWRGPTCSNSTSPTQTD